MSSLAPFAATHIQGCGRCLSLTLLTTELAQPIASGQLCSWRRGALWKQVLLPAPLLLLLLLLWLVHSPPLLLLLRALPARTARAQAGSESGSLC